MGLAVFVLSILIPVASIGTAEADSSTTTTPTKTTTPSKTTGTTTYSSKIDNPIKSKDLGALIGTITGAFVGAIGAIAVMAIVYGGVIYISSAGSEENVKKGKSIITYAVVGLGVALLAYVIVEFVIKSLLGAK